MARLRLTVHKRSGRARFATLETPRGSVQTPAFMPVGTRGAVKSVTPDQVWQAGTRILLCNAYHLFLRPGVEVVRNLGGLHRFMGWPGLILTDSGGFQVLSLGVLVSVDDDAVRFRSHLDGSLVTFTPETCIKAQVALGSDIIMCLDQPVLYPATREETVEAVRRTVLWAKRSVEIGIPPEQALFGIVQGSVYPDLRERCVEELMRLDFPGYAIGGLSVGEPAGVFYEVVRRTAVMLPEDRPRYLMGVGHPLDLVEGVLAGIDLFDCVLPTRNARHGKAYTFRGPLNVKGAAFKDDVGPIEEGCPCYACSGFSRGYIRHLLHEDEALGRTLLSIHNLTFFNRLMETIRSAIVSDSLECVREEIRQAYPRKGYESPAEKE